MAAKRKPVVTAKAVHYPGLSSKAYEHPADRSATAALRAIPGLDTAVRWLIEQGYERALFQQNLAASLRVGPDQLPDVWGGWTNVVTALDLPTASSSPPALYVAQDPWMNAMAIGSQNPYVVLTSRLVETANPDELRAAMAHEAGHILSGHVTYQTALTILLRASPAVTRSGCTAAGGHTARPSRVVPGRRALLRSSRRACRRRPRARHLDADGARRRTPERTSVDRSLSPTGGGVRGVGRWTGPAAAVRGER